MDYVHFNLVKHGLARHPAAWPYSSFHRCVAVGLYSAHWSHDCSPHAEWGERRWISAVGARGSLRRHMALLLRPC